MNEIKFNGDKLFKIRKSKKISQEKLALSIGVTRQTIYLWESKQSLPDIEKVGKICKALDINVSDLMDGVETQELKENEIKENALKEDKNLKTLKKKKVLKEFLFILIIIFIIHIVFSTIKFMRLNKILNKWKELDKNNLYNITIHEDIINRENNDIESYYEKTYKNGILIVLKKDSKNSKIESIMIYNYNTKYKYITNEEEKTYSKESLDENDLKYKLSSNFQNYYYFSNNYFLNFLTCLNPKFNITLNEVYEIKLNGVVQKIIDPETGLLKHEKTLDSKFSYIERDYQIELNTNKDFEINLDEYTEVTE